MSGIGSKIILLLALVLGGVDGCTLIRSTMGLPDKAINVMMSFNQEDKVNPVELQSELIRFADHYLTVANETTRKLVKTGSDLPERRTMLLARIGLTNDVLSIVTGANPYANLVDMISLVTVNRLNVENYWMPMRFGDSAKPMLLASISAEKEIWRIAGTTLHKQQIEELRRSLQAWQAQHPGGKIAPEVGTLNFVADIAKQNRSSLSSNANLFNILMIDPLSGLDPATRELANTTMAVERTLFLARHMPNLMRWETELLAIHTAEIPQLENLLASTRQLAESADRFSQVSERLPATLSTERQHIIAALNEQRPGLLSLANQTGKAMTAGKLMSDAVNTTLKTYQDLLRQMDSRSSETKTEPFRITDFTVAATKINTTVQQLAKLLEAFSQTASPERLDDFSARFDSLNRQAQATGKEVVDYAFYKLLLLLGFTAATVLLTSLAFWWLKNKFSRRPELSRVVKAD